MIGMSWIGLILVYLVYFAVAGFGLLMVVLLVGGFLQWAWEKWRGWRKAKRWVVAACGLSLLGILIVCYFHLR